MTDLPPLETEPRSAEAPGPSDAELITAVRSGDKAAFGPLYLRHVGSARALARQMTRDPNEAEDLVSEAFAKVLSVVQAGGGPDVAFRAYLLTALRRIAYDRTRSGSRITISDDLTPYDPGVPFVDPALEGLEKSIVSRAYTSLPERWQTVLWHTEVEGLTPAQVAPILGLTANGVAALAYRAREGLRQAYLQQHLAAPLDDGCRPYSDRLGAYARGGLSKRETAQVEEHLDTCPRCRELVLELTDVGSGMRAVVAPLVLGLFVAGYLSSGALLGTGGAAAAGAGALAGAGTTGGTGAGAGGGTGAGAGGAGAGAGGAGAGAGGAGAGTGAAAASSGAAAAGGGAGAGAAAAAAAAGVVGAGALTAAATAGAQPAAAAGATAGGSAGSTGAAAATAGAGAAAGAAVAGGAGGSGAGAAATVTAASGGGGGIFGFSAAWAAGVAAAAVGLVGAGIVAAVVIGGGGGSSVTGSPPGASGPVALGGGSTSSSSTPGPGVGPGPTDTQTLAPIPQPTQTSAPTSGSTPTAHPSLVRDTPPHVDAQPDPDLHRLALAVAVPHADRDAQARAGTHVHPARRPGARPTGRHRLLRRQHRRRRLRGDHRLGRAAARRPLHRTADQRPRVRQAPHPGPARAGRRGQ